MKPKVYIETTIPSYLTAKPTRDPIAATRQQITKDWWTNHRHHFDLFISDRVLTEAALGDPNAAARRLAEVENIPVFKASPEAESLVKLLVRPQLIPVQFIDDAVHVAIATVNQMDHLLTWNCRHIANAEIMRRLAIVVENRGYALPALCTPDQLMGK